MKIALFAAIEEEVSKIKDLVHFTGIGRENATSSILNFIDNHKNEDFTILNIGTVGAHSKPVGEILRVRQIVSGGTTFLTEPLLTNKFDIEDNIDEVTLFSSDCFVSPHVYSLDFLENLKTKADCFDMESSAVFSIAKHYGIHFVSYKIVSDHLDVDLDEWHRRVNTLSDTLCNFTLDLIEKLKQTQSIELI